jgi:hypothetical protein
LVAVSSSAIPAPVPAPVLVGVTAQDLQQEIPEAVKEKDGFLTVNTSPVLWSLVNAIKELYRLFTDRDREIASVKFDNQQIKAENVQLKKNAAIKAYLCIKDPNAPICK